MRHYNESALHNNLIPHPGVGPYHDDDDIVHHAYYQWVPFVLFSQCIMFYATHLLWKNWEGGKIKQLVDGLHMIALSKYLKTGDIEVGGKKLLAPKTLDNKVRLIKRAFYSHIMSNPAWGYKLMFCEVLNVLNVLLQFYVTNKFLGGKFYELGIHFINEDFNGEMDVLDTVFPKMTKCNFYKYGPSGSIQKFDTLCVMALNVINEKVYVFLWFWFVLLFFISVIALIWRVITIFFHARSTAFNRLVYSTLDRKLNPWDDIIIVTKHFSLSDWLFLYYIASNIEPFVFRNIIRELADEMRTPTSLSESGNSSPRRGTKGDDDDAKGSLLDFDDGASKSTRKPSAPPRNDHLQIDTVDAPLKFDIDDDTATLTPPHSAKHVKFS